MNSPFFLGVFLGAVLTVSNGIAGASEVVTRQPDSATRTFVTRGVIKEVKSDRNTVVIQHEEIPDYMPAMTMPFRVKASSELASFRNGDCVSFALKVTKEESWIEQVTRAGKESASVPASDPTMAGPNPSRPGHPLLQFGFTNELGQEVKLADFKGEALAITFFFTRCPIPEYCPRLSKNFQVACQKLLAKPNAPTNWHFLSVSFDTTFDTPAVLKTYAQHYEYNPAHWSFLTGPAEKIRELAALSDAEFQKEGGLFSHNFRTLIIDREGRLQMSFPIGGDLSDALVTEMLLAAGEKERNGLQTRVTAANGR